jgi:hypothetical protein
MEYSRDDRIRLGQEVVRETRNTAKVETGLLKRSIRSTLERNVIVFREIYYGAYNENSKLIENATRIMPKEIDWKVIFVDEDGREKEIKVKTRNGRTITRKSISTVNQSASNIKKLISFINGKKKNNTGEGSGGTDAKTS